MPWNGAGTFTLLHDWPDERDAGLPTLKISADSMQEEFDNVKTGLQNCLTKTGETTPSANQPMGGYLHTGCGEATARTMYARASQIQDGGLIWAGTIAGTVDAMTANLTPAITAYVAGMRVGIIVPGSGSNTVTTPSLALNSLAVKTIQRFQAALAAGDYTAGDVIDLIYDGTTWEIQTPSRLTSLPGTGTITSAMILDATIATGDIADSAITTAKIADSQITSAKIADATIATGDIANLAITTALIAANAVTSAKVDSSIMLTGVHMLPIVAGAMSSRTTNGAAAGTAETTTNKVMIKSLDFDASTNEYAQFMIPMPSSWDEGTVTAEFVWSPASGSGDVIWGLQAVALSNDDALDTAFGTVQTVTDTVLTAGDVHVTSATSAITIAGTPAAGDLVVFQVYRNASAGGDTLAVDARLLAVRLYITYAAGNDA